MTPPVLPHIVILGGGFAGLEAAFYLRARLAPEQAQITLVSEHDYCVHRPNTVYIPFGLDPESVKQPIQEPLHKQSIHFIQARALEVDPITRTVHLGDNPPLAYDYLIIATGAGVRPHEIPGLAEYAHTLWSLSAMTHLQTALSELAQAAAQGEYQRILFVVPPHTLCPNPLYELAMMLDTWLRRQDARFAVDITWTTYEPTYLQAFGPRLGEVLADEFAQRRIMAYTHHTVTEVLAHEVRYSNGAHQPYDLLITIPPHVAATPFRTLPCDERGFIHTDLATRQVVSHPEVFAIGDTSDFPVKQAYLAFLQADAASEQIAARILGTTPQFVFEPQTVYVMEEMDTAIYAQVPMRVTGRAEQPVEVPPEALDDYKIGTSPALRLGKSLFRVYLPWRFQAGQAFHSGLAWKSMELGLKTLSSLFAH